jgi:hypothetical protein
VWGRNNVQNSRNRGSLSSQPEKRSEPQENGIFHENQIIQIVFENFFCIIMMNAAAPKRDAPAAVLGTVNTKNHRALLCLGEALRQGTIAISWFFIVRQ